MQQGDFTQLAKHYHNRVGYSMTVLDSLRKLTGKEARDLQVADIGAGTGKLTENLVALGLKVISVEPNDSMREEGKKYTKALGVEWLKGSGEVTGLPSNAFDWVLMGSAFHWVNLEAGLKEFHRLLKPNAMFTAVWNPRDLERSPLQAKIDAKIKELVPELKRVSSGGKGYADDWFAKLPSTGLFTNVLFTEGKDTVPMTREQYMGLWHSVNDIQAQAGAERWQTILKFIEKEISSQDKILSPYSTRAWTVWKKG